MPFISFAVDDEFMAQIERAVVVANTQGETTRSQFIRTALREKIRNIEVIRPTDADPEAEPVVYLDIEK